MNASPRAAPVLARLLLHGAFLSLWIVWLARPESPSDLYRILIGGVLALMFVPLILLRGRWLGILARFVRPLDVVSVNLLLLLVCGEGGLRLLAAAYPESPMLVAPDAKAQEKIRRARLAPGTEYLGFPVNSLGLFDEEFSLERAPGVRRILALGDSFAVGVVPYPDNYLTLLDEHVRPRGYEVLNYGIAGTGPREYLHVYRTEGRAYEAELVLLSFFIGNDFGGKRSASLLHAETLYLFTIPGRFWSVQAEWQPPKDWTPGISEEYFLSLEVKRIEIARVDAPDLDEEYEAAFSIMREISEEAGDRLRVVIIPSEFQVNDDHFAALVKDEAEHYDRDMPTRRLRAFLEAEKIPYLDLLEPLRKAEAGGLTYWPRDTHWNKRGNRIAADEIAGWLEKELP